MVLQLEFLRPGDVGLSTQRKSSISWIIRTATGSPISHAAIHVGGGFLVEAVGTGVRRIHCRRLEFEGPGSVRVVRPQLDNSQISDACAYAKSQSYRPYAWRKALGTHLPPLMPGELDGWFCSELVAESFRHAGLEGNVLGDPTSVVPGDFLQNSKFTDITDNAVRSLRTPSLERAVQTLEESFALWSRLKWSWSTTRAELEELCLLQAVTVMVDSGFPRPNRVAPVWHAIRDTFKSDRILASTIDARVLSVLRQAGAAEGAVAPDPVVPGLQTTPLGGQDEVITFDVGETKAEAMEFASLMSDLIRCKESDLKERDETIGEIRALAKRTELPGLKAAQHWEEWDKWHMTKLYSVFDHVSTAVQIDLD